MAQEEIPSPSHVAVPIFWAIHEQQWDKQQYILRYACPKIDSTSIERYANQMEAQMKRLREKNVVYLTFYHTPEWVMQELSDRRLPLTWESVASILIDPLGVDHFGFHTPLPRKKMP